MMLHKFQIKVYENLALYKSVQTSAEGAAEPGLKAVDGKVDNNSKWCAAGANSGWLTIDLGEPKIFKDGLLNMLKLVEKQKK